MKPFTKWDLYVALLSISVLLVADVMDIDGWEGFFRAVILGALVGTTWVVGGFAHGR